MSKQAGRTADRCRCYGGADIYIYIYTSIFIHVSHTTRTHQQQVCAPSNQTARGPQKAVLKLACGRNERHFAVKRGTYTHTHTHTHTRLAAWTTPHGTHTRTLAYTLPRTRCPQREGGGSLSNKSKHRRDITRWLQSGATASLPGLSCQAGHSLVSIAMANTGTSDGQLAGA